MKYALTKNCCFSRKNENLIGISDFSYCEGKWNCDIHFDKDVPKDSLYEHSMKELCKYVEKVIVPNGQQSVEYLIKKLKLQSVGLNRYQLYTSTNEANFCIRFINDAFAKVQVYVYMLKKEY